MKKIVSVLAVLCLLAGLAYVGWRVSLDLLERGKVQAARSVPAVPVEVRPVSRVTLRDVGRFTGSLVAETRFTVAPQVGGRLKQLLVDLGDPVQQSQLVAVLEDEEFVQQVARARAELAVAEASVQEVSSTLQNALREHERASTLRAKKIASESEFDQAVAQLEVQQSRLRVAESQVLQKRTVLREAEIRLSYTQIRAFWEGGSETRYVGERLVAEGALVVQGSPLASIIDLAELTAVIFVIERDFAKVVSGQAAVISTDAYPGSVFPGRIARIAPQLQESSRQARVEIRVPNPDLRLKPGMFARVELEFAERTDAQAVPMAALLLWEGRSGLFVVEPDGATARFLEVRLGIHSGEWVEALSPTIDRPVVVMGQHLLEDGAAVRIVGGAASRPAVAR